mgnify:CR=1 FL=1
MTAMTETRVTTQVYRVYIKATPRRSGMQSPGPSGPRAMAMAGEPNSTCEPTGSTATWPVPRCAQGAHPRSQWMAKSSRPIPPRKLVLSWRMLMDPEMAAEGFTRLTWEIEPTQGGVTKLTVTHELEGAPKLALIVGGSLEKQGAGGGWAWILSDLKTLLETGKRLD